MKIGVGSSVRRWADVAPRRATVKQDLVAGVPGAISSVPDGMAAGVLAGVSPVHGLYASIFCPIGGGLTSSRRADHHDQRSALAPDRRCECLRRRSRGPVPADLDAGGLMVAAAILRLGRFTIVPPR